MDAMHLRTDFGDVSISEAMSPCDSGTDEHLEVDRLS